MRKLLVKDHLYLTEGDRVRHIDSGTFGTVRAFWVVWDDYKEKPNETGFFTESVLEKE